MNLITNCLWSPVCGFCFFYCCCNVMRFVILHNFTWTDETWWTSAECGLVSLPPHLHLTTSKVMVIVWRIRGNIIRTVLYIANVLPLQWAQLTKTVHTARLALSLSFCVLLGCMIYLMLVYVLFYLGQLSHFPSCFGAGVTNLNEPPWSCLLSPRRCGLGAGSIPFRAIVNKKQCETRGLFMSLVIHYWIGCNF